VKQSCSLSQRLEEALCLLESNWAPRRADGLWNRYGRLMEVDDLGGIDHEVAELAAEGFPAPPCCEGRPD
jgi:hypothetical protein